MKYNDLVIPCVACRRPADHAHHFIPRSRGGKLTVPLCAGCHRKLHTGNPTVTYIVKRFLLRLGLDLDEVKYLLEGDDTDS